jgi:hypothetical protein
MEKRYQVFISSTFRDLVDERQGVLRAVLELDHMPAGMELFPAADDTAWQLISDVIDASDYYVLIVGGRYGSLDDTGIGYTEKEYDYALSKKKPVIALLHKNPDNLPREKTETEETTWKKLRQFREKVEKRHTCVYWTSSEELKAKVIVALTAVVKRHPGVGWVRADQVPAEATLSELLSLRRRIAELEAEIAADRLAPPKGTEDLKQGDDTFQFNVAFKARPSGEWSSIHDSKYSGAFKLSWNEIFAGIAPILINEAPDDELRAAFNRHLVASAKEAYQTDKKLKGMELRDFVFSREQVETCVVQLRALGLIKENQKPRSVKDTRTYWTLTQYGDHLMVQLRALRRTPLAPAEAASELSTSTLGEEDEGDTET